MFAIFYIIGNFFLYIEIREIRHTSHGARLFLILAGAPRGRKEWTTAQPAHATRRGADDPRPAVAGEIRAPLSAQRATLGAKGPCGKDIRTPASTPASNDRRASEVDVKRREAPHAHV